ncbi:MAG: acyltransferase [Daejeonella sp.]|nr:acyltransferase [Daejeonella sp.]
MKNNDLKIESVQLLRAVAVLLVVYAHAFDIVDKKPLQSQFYYLENWGAIGLDLFFVISGFIMTIVTPRYIISRDWKDFTVKRIIRIIPLYWILSFSFSAMLLLKGTPNTVSEILKTLFFFPFFDIQFTAPIIHVGWSLSLEIYFYLLISLFLVRAGAYIYKYLILTLVSLAIIGFIFNPENALINFLTNPLLIEFALGILAGVLYKKLNNAADSKRNKLRALAIVLTVLGSVWMLGTIVTGYFNVSEARLVLEDSKLAFIRSIVWGIPCFILLLGLVSAESLFNLKIPRFFILMGDASYSCYLLHRIFFLPLSKKVFTYLHFQNTDLFILFSLLVVIAGSILFYLFFEKKLIRISSRLLDGKAQRTKLAAA